MKFPFAKIPFHTVFTFWLVVACVGSIALAGPAFALDGVGSVISLKPGAYVQRGGQRLPLELKSRIHQKDTVVTDQSGRLQIIFDDDTTVALAPDTRLAIETVITEGKPQFKNHLSTGLARFITGKIVEQNPEGFEISTPQGTVGIRGTVLAVQTDGQFTSAHHLSGSANLTLNGVTVPAGSTGTLGPGGTGVLVEPTSEGTRQGIEGSTSGLGGGGGGTTAGGSSLDTGTPSLLGTAGSGTPGLDANNGPRNPLESTGMRAEITGTLNVVMAAGTPEFGFSANLFSGLVSNGWIKGPVGDIGNIEYVNGSGRIENLAFTISDYVSRDPAKDATGTFLNGQMEQSGNTLTVTQMAGTVFDRSGSMSFDVTLNSGGGIIGDVDIQH